MRIDRASFIAKSTKRIVVFTNRVVWFVVILTSLGSTVYAGGLVRGLLDYAPMHTSDLEIPSTFRGSSLRDPAMVKPASAMLAIELDAENLLRTRTGGKLTADMTTWSRTKSLILPFNVAGGETIVGFSMNDAGANLFYDDPDLGSHFSWNVGSHRWAIGRNFGVLRVGLGGFWCEGRGHGWSLYPQRLFSVFSGASDAQLSWDESITSAQFSFPLGSRGKFAFAVGNGNHQARIGLGSGSSQIEFPICTRTRRYDVDLVGRLGNRVTGRFGYSWSLGSSIDPILYGGSSVGTLRSWPGYSRFEASMSIKTGPTVLWEMGYVSAGRNLELRGSNIQGKKLGLRLQPFNELVDFTSGSNLRARFLHIGTLRHVSKKWQLGARYKLIRVDSAVEGDYIGRMFFGLVSAGGDYRWTPVKQRFHGLDLSAVYTSGRFALSLRLEQLIPEPKKRKGQAGPPRPKTSSTGGTSAGVTLAYGF